MLNNMNYGDCYNHRKNNYIIHGNEQKDHSTQSQQKTDEFQVQMEQKDYETA